MKKEPKKFELDGDLAMERRAVERAALGMLFDSGDYPTTIANGVAVVSIEGPLMQRGGWWWDGYEAIRERFDAAIGHSAVRTVVLKINSPGGVTAGCFEAVRAMQATKKSSGKRVIAFADESAYSAAYALACVADEIYLPREGGVGSVGVITSIQDWSRYNNAMGVHVAVVTSGKRKADGHPDVPLSKETLDVVQKRVDALGESFAELVAGARGTNAKTILGLEAGCFYGQAAVDVGLANGVSSFNALPTTSSAARATTHGKQAAMSQISKTVEHFIAMNGFDRTKFVTAMSTIKLTAEDELALAKHGTDREMFVAIKTQNQFGEDLYP